MFQRVLQICYKSVDAAYNWFVQLMDSVPGFFGFFLGVFAIWATIRFILSPIAGGRLPFSGASDRARRSKDGDVE